MKAQSTVANLIRFWTTTWNQVKTVSYSPGEPAIKFDVATGIFTWTPPESAEGDYELKMSANNEFGTDEKVFVVSVGESGGKEG